LPAGTYFFRVFLDQNGNDRWDAFETFGFIADESCQFLPAMAIALNDSLQDQSVMMMHRDTDTDGMPDAWEYYYFGTLSMATTATDSDLDGFADYQEYRLGTNPNTLDSDQDGLNDFDELVVNRTAADNADTDGDSLVDGQEQAMGLNPLATDDDEDGVPTRLELLWDGLTGYLDGSDMNPGRADTDSDGVADAEEVAAGGNPLNPTDARRVCIRGLQVGDDGAATVGWNQYRNRAGIHVGFRLECSTNMTDWTEVGRFTSGGDEDSAVQMRDPTPRANVYYRLRFSVVE
jgi:hypothetical protein